MSDEPTSETPDVSSPARAAHLIGDLILDKKGEDLVVIDVEAVTVMTEYIVIANGTSSRQILTMAEELRARDETTRARLLRK